MTLRRFNWHLAVLVLLFLFPVSGKGASLDSLYGVLKTLGPGEQKVDVLLRIGNRYLATKKLDSAEWAYDQGLTLARELGYTSGEASALHLYGILTMRKLKPFDEVSIYLLQSLILYEQLQDSAGVAGCHLQLGVVNYSIGNYLDAKNDLQSSIAWSPAVNSGSATARYLLGLCYSEIGEYDSAHMLLVASLHDYAMGDEQKLLMVRSFLGKLLSNQKRFEEAVDALEEAVAQYPDSMDSEYLTVPRSFLSTAYFELGDLDKARFNGLYVLENIEITSGITYWIEASRNLHRAYAKMGLMDEAYHTLLNLKIMADSVGGSQVLERISTQKARYEFEKETIRTTAERDLEYQEQLRKQARLRDVGLGSGLVALLMAIGFYSRMRFTRKAKRAIEKEKERSDALLLNILPEEVAEELKAKGESSARMFGEVSILFTDFKNFTNLAEGMNPDELVSELNHCFKAFDHICEKYGIEKIKTLGDSYMAASGLPVPSADSAHRLVLAGLEMQAFVEQRKQELSNTDQQPFEMRAGIHSGKVVAGIVGVKKFQYDVWGDTVNTASRMESHGEVGKVNISQTTYELIKDDPKLTFEHRGKVEAKGKGEVDMYFVRRTS